MIIKLKTFQRFLILSHRGAVFALAVVSAILSSTGFADDNRKLPKIGALFFQDQPTAAPYQRALRDGLRELGYVDGKTATFVTRFADGDATKLSALMADILAQKVDVIWVGRRALRVARQMTTTTPLVTFFSDPIEERLVKSFARPGGNITGVSWQSNESSGKRLQYTMELVPGLKRVTLLYDPGDPSTVLDAEASHKAALGVGLAVDSITFRNAAEFETSLAQIARTKPQAMIVVHNALTVQHRDEIIRFAIRARLPLISEGPDWGQAGALLSYGPSIVDMFTRAAGYMGKILKGAKPGELPIEQPTVFELVVNDLDDALSKLSQAGLDGIFIVPDALTISQRQKIADWSLRAGLPTMAAWSEYTKAGALMSYGPNLRDAFRRAASYVDKILKGAKPAELPVEQPMRLELTINLRTARALGLTIPESVLIQADEVIR